jgi:ribonuclease HI
MERVVVYTDGACSGNPGPGGWGWAVSPGGEPRGSGGAADTTNQRMEVYAVLDAIRTLGVDQTPIEIVSDSTYVVNCFRDSWWVKWEKNGWKNSKKQPVANIDLWKPLIEVVRHSDVKFTWVKGHSGHPMNDLADQLAVAATPR